MERGEGDRRVEALVRLPPLERDGDDLDGREVGQVAPGDGREALAQLDADDLKAALCQRQGGLACSRPELEDPVARSQARERLQVIEELCRIGGPGPVVELGVLLERRSQPVAFRGGRSHAAEP